MCRFAIWTFNSRFAPHFCSISTTPEPRERISTFWKRRTELRAGFVIPGVRRLHLRKLSRAIRRPTRYRCGCASVCRADFRSAAPTHFPNRWMMRLRSARGQRRVRILPDWAQAARARGGGGSSGGGTANVAQNPFDLSAERGLSSFNQTHKFTADYLWELPFGHDKRWLTGNTPLARDAGRLAMEWRLDDCIGAAVHAENSGRHQ